MLLTIHPMRRFFKRAGAKRVSHSAAEELAKVVEREASRLAAEAQRLSEHSHRKTVMRRDVKMARKNLKL